MCSSRHREKMLACQHINSSFCLSLPIVVMYTSLPAPRSPRMPAHSCVSLCTAMVTREGVMSHAQIVKASGFTLIELMVVLAILAMAAGFSAPHLQKWMRSYRLKGAVMDLHSNMQLAKANAVKENRPWLLQFDASGTYTVIQCLTNT